MTFAADADVEDCQRGSFRRGWLAGPFGLESSYQVVMEPNTLGCCSNPSSLYAPENIGSLSLAPQDGSFIMLVEMEDWKMGLEVEL